MFTKVLRNAMWLGTGEAVVKGGLLLVTVLVARGMGADGVGTFSIAYAAALVGIMLLAGGQQEVLIREVARSPERAGTLLASARRLQRSIGLWLLPAVVVGLLVLSDRELGLALAAFVPYVLLRTATVTRGATFKGMDRMDVEVRARVIEVAAALVCIASAVGFGWPVWCVGAAFSLGAAGGLGWISRRDWGVAQTDDSTPTAVAAREGLPFMAVAVVGQLLMNTDRFLLEFFAVSRAEIGFWGAAGTIVWALVAVPQLIAVGAYPSISRIASGGVTWSRAGAAMFAGGAMVGAAGALAVRVLAEPIVRILFGPDFAPAVALTERLSLVLPGAFALMTIGTVFAAWRRQVLALWVLVTAFAVSLVLNIMWIPRFGAMACANAAIVSYSAAAIVLILLLVSPVRSISERR